MHAVPHRPVRGNWIWLGSGLLTVTALALAALHYAGDAVPGPMARGTAAGAAHHGAARAGAASASGGAAGAPAGRPLVRAALPAELTAGVAVAGAPAAGASCPLSPLPAGGWYVSVPRQLYAGSAACGTYLSVQGSRQLVHPEVVGVCRRCAAGVIRLSPAVFARLAGAARGRARVSFWPAVNPPLHRALVVRAAASPAGHVAVQVLHTGNPLLSVALRAAATPAAPWRPLRLDGHGFWVAAGPVGRGPFALRLADNRGHQVVLGPVRLAAGAVTRTRVLMYRAGPLSRGGRPGWRVPGR